MIVGSFIESTPFDRPVHPGNAMMSEPPRCINYARGNQRPSRLRSNSQPNPDGVGRVGDQLDGESQADDDEEGLDDLRAAAHGDAGADLGPEDRTKAHGQADLPEDGA